MSAYTRDRIKNELKVIRERLLTSEQVLDSSAGEVLDYLDAQLDDSRSSKKWHFEIPSRQPLRFRSCTVEDCKDMKFNSIIDISGKFPAPIDGAPAKGHIVVVRVWTSDQAIWYVEHLDAESLCNKINPTRGRVMHRFHFDAASSPNEPWSHLHIGGRKRDSDEYFRFPEDQALPRFFHHPMGLIQTCEFVLYHYFPDVHTEVTRDDSWRYALNESEKAYLDKYWARLKHFCRDGTGGASFLGFSCAPC